MISIIVAIAEDNVIGGGNSLLWHISEDLKRFKAITQGHTVIMGRKTYESIGKPLPHRRNIVLSRNPGFSAEGVEVFESLDSVIDSLPASEECFIIGGGEIYKLALPLADKFYLTKVYHRFDGDTYFPQVDWSQWTPVFNEYCERGDKFPYPFEFTDYIRNK